MSFLGVQTTETKRIFVTGATGFIGHHLVEELVSKGHDITCLVRDPKKKNDVTRMGMRSVEGDLTNFEKWKTHVRGQDVVFHLAAIRGEWNIPWEKYYRVNVEATQKLAKISAQAGVSKFLYISSVGVHGTSPMRVPADEETPYNPDSYYHTSKMLAEQAVLEQAESLTTIVVRPTITYGPSDTGFLYRIASNVRKGFFPVVGRGNSKIHILYVKGLVEALTSAMEVNSKGQVYLLADRNPIEFRNLIQAVAFSMRKKVRIIRLPFKLFLELSKIYDIFVTPMVKGLSMKVSFKLLSLPWYYSINKAVNEIGYQPYQTEEMVKKTIAWYIQQGWL